MCIVTNLDIVKIRKNDFDVFKNNTQIWFSLFSAVVTVPKFTDFYFSVEPTNVIAIRDQSALFNCAVYVGDLTANGEITPTVEWLKDGQKLNLQDDNRR